MERSPRGGTFAGAATRVVALVGLLALAACGPRISCPIGQQPLCQSGSIHGTRCYCVEPGGLNH